MCWVKHDFIAEINSKVILLLVALLLLEATMIQSWKKKEWKEERK